MEFQKNVRQKKLIEREKKLRAESEKTLQCLIFKYQRSQEAKGTRVAKRSFEFDFDLAEGVEEEDFIALDNAYKHLCSDRLFEGLDVVEKREKETGGLLKAIEGLQKKEQVESRFGGLAASTDFKKLAIFDLENHLQVFNFRESKKI